MRKHVLVTGINSRIGNSLEKYLIENDTAKEVIVERKSLKSGIPKEEELSRFDVIIHVAAITQTDTHKLSPEVEAKYYEVNTDLTIKLAQKAKECDVKHFIYLSTMMVYGNPGFLNEHFLIDGNTIPHPQCVYGKSKYEGESILSLADESFSVSIIREPLIYGPSFDGEISKLGKLSKIIHVFPNIKCKKSIIHQHNLCVLIGEIVEQERGGVFCPQDKDCLTISELYARMSRCNGKRIILIPVMGWFMKLMALFISPIMSLCSDIAYDERLSIIEGIDYQLYSIEDMWKE